MKTYGNINCMVCGTSFIRKSSRQLCCSNECSHIRKKRINLEKYHTLPKTHIKCNYCGKEFVKTNGGFLYCSKECRIKNTHEPKNKICKHCGKPFIDATLGQKYCTDLCRLEYKKEYDLEYIRNNYHRRKKTHKSWRDRNRERLNIESVEWRKNNQDKIRLTNKRRLARIKHSPKLSIDCRMAGMLGKTLRGNKKGRSWKEFVPYSLDELKIHLEKKFTKEMTWEKFLNGEIHIDHIIPRKLFTYTNYENLREDGAFQKCWSLQNLQPLWKKDNLTKGAKYHGQPL
jgi:hypothetical protein